MDFSLLGFHGFKELFNVHPVFVHFPIGLFPLSLFLYALNLKVSKEGLGLAAHLTLLLAVVSAIITTATGLFAEDSIPHNDTIHQMMETHETLGYFIAATGVALALWSFIQKNGKPRLLPGFIGTLALTCLIILLNADLGARMVFVQGAGVKIAVPLIERGYEHHHDEGDAHDSHHDHGDTNEEE